MSDSLPSLSMAEHSGQDIELDVRHRITRLDVGATVYFDKLMGIFSDVAHAGGFWSGGSPEQRTKLDCLLPASDESGELVVRVRVSSLDPRMWQCWRHMVGRLRKFDINVDSVALTAPAVLIAKSQAIEFIDERNEETAYPLASPELQNVLRFEGGDAAKSRRCLVEMDRPLTAGEITQFEKWTQPWFAMLEAAAFSCPIGAPHEEECLSGVVSQFDETTIELTVDRFRASEQAWMVLGNMTAVWWRPRARALRFLVD